MIYIYDILLNFNNERLIDFYEWEVTDDIYDIKRIPLFRVDSKTINDLEFNTVKFNNEFLDKIIYKSFCKNMNVNDKYIFLLTDLSRILAFKLDDRGITSSRSFLLPNDEIEALELAFKLKEINISYEVIRKDKNEISFLTRNETKKQEFLLKEIKYLYKIKDIDRINYYSLEYFNKKCLDINKTFKELTNSLLNNFDYKWLKIYDLVKLSYK